MRPFLLAVFFASGASGLVYQIVWSRMLVRVFGGTVAATSAVVAVFMGGLALGVLLSTALFTGRGRRATAKTYAAIELAVAVTAVAVTLAIPAMPAVFARLVDESSAHLFVDVVRISLSALVLLAPTALMGLTLPVLVDVLAGDELGAPLGRLYAANTAGAVVGVLVTGFFALPLFGELATVLGAAALNGVVGAVVFIVAVRRRSASVTTSSPLSPAPAPAVHAPETQHGIAGLVVTTVAGGASLALELAWTRLATFLVGTSVYAFSTILAAFLVGIALGSALAARFIARIGSANKALGVALVVAGALALLSLRVLAAVGAHTVDTKYLYSPLVDASDAFSFLLVGLFVITPVTVVFGALFPLCVKAYAVGHDVRAVARIYAANTIAGVVGSLGAGFFLLPQIGAQATVVLIGSLLLVAGVVALLRSNALPEKRRIVLVGIVALGLLAPRDNIPLALISARIGTGFRVIRHDEGSEATTTVAVPVDNNGGAQLLLNGILTSMRGRFGDAIADFPLLLQEHPKRALIICLGAGNTFNTTFDHLAAVDQGFHIDLVDLVAGVYDVQDALHPASDAHLKDAHVSAFVNDGRNHLLVNDDKYDLIVFDGTPPIFAAGSANAYSREFAALARDHLTPTGILLLWAPLPAYPADIETIAAAVGAEFPHIKAWWAEGTPGVMILGSRSDIVVDVDAIARRQRERKRSALPAQLIADGFIDDAMLAQAIAQTPPMTDDHPTTEYPLLRLLAGEKPRLDARFLRR